MSSSNQFKPGNPHTFKPGQSGNPGGSTVGYRRKIQGAFVRALAEDFEAHGKRAIERCREDDPVNYVKVIASLLPKQVEESKPLDDVTDVELVAGIALLQAQLTGSPAEGTGIAPEPQPTH